MCPETKGRSFPDLLQGSFASRAKERAAELAVQRLPQAQGVYDANLRRQEDHDTLLDICASAFGPDSRAFRELGFAFLSSEPLKEKEVRSFDCLLYGTKSRHAIFVECKSSISSVGDVLADTRAAIAVEVEYRKYLEDQIGGPIEVVEYVLCVPSTEFQDTFRAIKKSEDGGRSVREPPILLWQVDKFSSQRLELCTLMDWRKAPLGQHLDAGLTRLLAGGVSVEHSEMLAKVYPSSHPVRVGREILTEAWRRQKPQKPGRLTIMPDQIRDWLADPSTMPHYASDQIAPGLLRKFVRDAEDHGLLEGPASGAPVLSMKVDGKQLPTILRGYERTHRDEWTKRYARKLAEEAVVEEYYRTQRMLTEPEGG